MIARASEWFLALDEPYRSIALRELRIQRHGDRQFNSLANALEGSFGWSRTPEINHITWMNLHRSLLDRELAWQGTPLSPT